MFKSEREKVREGESVCERERKKERKVANRLFYEYGLKATRTS